MTAPYTGTGRIGDSALAARLGRELSGQVLFDAASRGRYSTDASIYQIEPIGVVVPRDEGDIVRAIQIAADEGIPLLPRGGGTSQCGQTVGEALVDMAAHATGLDVLEIRRRNIMPDDGYPVISAAGIHLQDLSHQRCLDGLADAMDYEALRAEQVELRERGVYRGIASETLAATVHTKQAASIDFAQLNRPVAEIEVPVYTEIPDSAKTVAPRSGQASDSEREQQQQQQQQ